MKTCSVCNLSKEAVDFSKDQRAKDGLQYRCKSCHRVFRTTSGRDGLTVDQRRALLVGTDGLTANQRRFNLTPAESRARHLKFLYGITPDAFNLLLASQDYRCAICQKEKQTWCVDHDHLTRKIRAILCPKCNFALGNLCDSAKLAVAAAKYLIKHGNL